MKFTKMHGLGNDFIIFENIEKQNIKWEEIAKRVCDRHFGVGADGIMVVESSDIADTKMTIINSDGSIAEMCGNGIRCFSRYVYEKNIVQKDIIKIETLAGIMTAFLKIEDSKVTGIKINMGSPEFEKALIPFSGQENNLNYSINTGTNNYDASTLLLGVPHTIVYVNNIDNNEIITEGKKIEIMDKFPSRTNVNFVKVIDKNSIEIRTWERGAGLTLACGTGTCASIVASYLNGLTENKVEARLFGGVMFIEYDGTDVFMEGPAEFICEGNIMFQIN
jgi:diaminopimelate epimerase